MKSIAVINWVLIGLIGSFLVYGLTLMNPQPDAAGRGVETTLVAVAFFALLALAGLNLLPYAWMKLAALFIEVLVLSLIWYLRTH